MGQGVVDAVVVVGGDDEVGGVAQSQILGFSGSGSPVPPNQTDADYRTATQGSACMPGASECHGLLLVRFLCKNPGPIIK